MNKTESFLEQWSSQIISQSHYDQQQLANINMWYYMSLPYTNFDNSQNWNSM